MHNVRKILGGHFLKCVFVAMKVTAAWIKMVKGLYSRYVITLRTNRF